LAAIVPFAGQHNLFVPVTDLYYNNNQLKYGAKV